MIKIFAKINLVLFLVNGTVGCKTSVDISDAPPLGSPVANAGQDQTVSTGVTVTLSGSGADSDGTIASYLWEQIADGGSVSLSGAKTETTSSALVAPSRSLSTQTIQP